jgi:hypothetical protein
VPSMWESIVHYSTKPSNRGLLDNSLEILKFILKLS